MPKGDDGAEEEFCVVGLVGVTKLFPEILSKRTIKNSILRGRKSIYFISLPEVGGF